MIDTLIRTDHAHIDNKQLDDTIRAFKNTLTSINRRTYFNGHDLSQLFHAGLKFRRILPSDADLNQCRRYSEFNRYFSGFSPGGMTNTHLSRNPIHGIQLFLESLQDLQSSRIADIVADKESIRPT